MLKSNAKQVFFIGEDWSKFHRCTCAILHRSNIKRLLNLNLWLLNAKEKSLRGEGSGEFKRGMIDPFPLHIKLTLAPYSM